MTVSLERPQALKESRAVIRTRRYFAENGGLVFACLVLLALFVVPLLNVILRSFTDPSLGLANYETVFTGVVYGKVIVNTVISAVLCTVASVVLAYPLAYAAANMGRRVRRIVVGIVLFAYVSGSVPRAFAWLVVLGDRGLINSVLTSWFGLEQPIQLIYNLFGVVVGMVHSMLPFTVLLLLGSMARVNGALVPAARTLGAGPIRAFLSVYLPLTRSGILAAGMLVLIYSFGFYVVPAVLGGAGQTTVVMMIQNLTLNLGAWGLGSSLAVLVSLVAAVGALIYLRITGLSSLSEED